MTVNPDALTRLIGDLDRFARRTHEQAEQIDARLAAAATTIERPEFRITVNGARITDLTFTARAISASPVQLRDAVLRTYATAASEANRRTGETLTGLGLGAAAAGVGEALPAELADTEPLPGASTVDEARGASTDPPAEHHELPPVEIPVVDVDDPSLDAELGDGTIAGIMADVEGYDPAKLVGDPNRWQAELTEHLRSIASRQQEMTDRLGQVTAEVASDHLRLTIGAGGRPTELRWTNLSATTAEDLTTEFRETYARGLAEVAAAATAVIRGDSGSPSGEGADDPVGAMFDRWLAAPDEEHEEHSERNQR